MQTNPNQADLLPIPDKIEVNENFSQLTISYRWFNPSFYFLVAGILISFGVLITIFWDAPPFYDLSFFKKLLDAPSYELYVIVLSVFTGIYYTYYAICSVLNKTIVEVDSHAIKIRFEPLPWIGSDKILRADIKQLYTIQHVQSRGSHSNLIISYRVKAVTQSNRNILLVQDIETAEQARFLERKIENYLGITNKKVEGEYAGGIEEPKAWFGDWHM